MFFFLIFFYFSPLIVARIPTQSFLDHLSSTFHFQLLTFFWSTLEVHIKLNLGLFLNPHKKKMGLYPNPNRMRDWDMNEGMNQPIKRIGFSLQPKTPQIRKRGEKMKNTWSGYNYLHDYCSLYPENERSLFLKCKKKPLI